MSIWSWFIGEKNNESTRVALGENNEPVVPSYDASRLAFVDIEVGLKDHKIHDIGAVRYDGAFFHKASKGELFDFLKDVHYVCGHNIINHDAKYLFGDKSYNWLLVDTLYMSPLLFPERPYHKLVKDDKLMNEQINNPVNDCEKARDLLMDEIARWQSLPEKKRTLFASLLRNKKEFKGFLSMVGADSYEDNLADFIKRTYHGKICSNADVAMLVAKYPCELAYALALIDTTDYRSVTPGWVLLNYPSVEFVVKLLRDTPCSTGCPYCNAGLDIHSNLKYFFGYDEFRTYEGEPLQEKAARAAVEGKSLLAIFPTGGGKSLTFQLPALMEGRSVHGLTVVISPLQSLMKDQVDNLVDRGITDAVTINGLLDPISRALAIKRVQDGDASLLYIAPEMLRSKTIEKILLARHVVRFVIDEAHCFSSWGQDFRVDYLYIGKFIRDYQKKKGCKNSIAVSCFTATAKQKVVQDICDYFKHTLDIDLSLFASTASRTNLHYSVIHADTDDDKYLKLRELVAESSGCPTIIYVSRTKRTKDLASKLTRDGYKALPFNGRMEADEKVANQNAFMNDNVRIIVATSAFGMGVDKKDVESVFQSAGVPAYHVLGNHDMDNISKDDFLSNTSNPGEANAKAYYSFTVKGVKCIVLDANYNEDGSHYDCGNFDWTYAMVPKEEIAWLKKELNEGNEDIIVFIHQLLSKSAPSCVCVQNASEIRSLFESNSRVKVVFQGHHHEGHYEEINGIHYITIPGMIEGESPENNTYAVVELDKNGRILVDGYRKCPDRILETRK